MIRLLTETDTVQRLPVWFDVTVMAVNGLLGAAVARSRNIMVLGTLLAAVLVGLGGGIVRDMMLGLEPAAVSNWVYLPAVLAGGFIGALLFGRVLKRQWVFALIQGIVLGFLVTIGAQKALDYDAPVTSAVLLGVVTGAVGGMLADLVTGHRALLSQMFHWIALSLLAGAIAFVPISVWIGFWPAVIVAVVVAAFVRTLAQTRQWSAKRWPGQSTAATPEPSGAPDGTV